MSQSNWAGIDFIKRELETGITMARLAITEWTMADAEAATRAEANAKKSYAGFIRFLPLVEAFLTGADREQIERSRRELEAMIALFIREDDAS